MTEQNQDQEVQSAADTGHAGIALNVPEVAPEDYEPREVSFFFKKNKELDIKRDTVKLKIPTLTVDGVVNIFSKGDPKELDLILEAINAKIVDQARVQVNENETIDQDTLDVSKLTWEAIANLPQAERRGGGIPKETWEEFGKDYTEVMAAATGKKPEVLERHVGILLKKFAGVKSQKNVIAAFQNFLATYAASTKELEQFQECVDFLQNKAETLLAADEEALLENL